MRGKKTWFTTLLTTGVLGAVLLIGSAGNASAGNALSVQSSTNIPFLPDLKLFIGQGLTPAFDLAAFNHDTGAVNYSISENFLDLASLNDSYVNQSEYSLATTGTNVFVAEGVSSNDTVSNKVKYSTYKIYQLPKIGLTAGKSFDFDLGTYVRDSEYNFVCPPSFGVSSSLSFSNESTLMAQWVNESVLRIIASGDFSEPAWVDVIASPSAVGPFADYDRERLWVYPNLVPNGTFDSEDIMNLFTYEKVSDREVMAEYSFVSTASDLQMKEAEGVLAITLDSYTTGIKITPQWNDLVAFNSGDWFIARMRVSSNFEFNSDQALLFNYSNPAFPGNHVDIAANVWFSIPTTWTWLETPVYSNRTGMGYPQMQFKGGLILVTPKDSNQAKDVTQVFVDEVQLIKAVPTLMESRAGDSRVYYSPGDFDDPTDLLGWGLESYTYDEGTTALPGAAITDGVLRLSFDTTSSALIGAKLTAYANNADTIQTFRSIRTRGFGAQAKIVGLNGGFDSYESIVLIAAMGVQRFASYEIGTRGSDLFAAAEFGGLSEGVHYAFGNAFSPNYQVQFAVKSDQPGTIDFDDFDGISESGEEYFGDGNLF